MVSDNGTMSDPFASLHLSRSSTVDRVVEELRRAVFEGELESGTPLREVALADSLGVARSTLREALGVLVSDGIATREPNRGVTVSSPDPEAIRDVCRARLVLESAGARCWAEAAESDRQRMRDAVAAYGRAVAEGASYQSLNESHLAIHLALVGLTGSPRLLAMAESVVGELRVALARIDRIRRNAHAQADSHGHLLELLESGDQEQVAAAIAAHLADAETAVVTALERVDQRSG